MAESLTLEHVAMTPKGPTLSLSLAKGQSLCVIGPAGSGKTSFLRLAVGEDRPANGAVRRCKRISIAAPVELARRVKPQSLARQGGEGEADLAAEVLSALHLWEDRSRPVTELSPSQLVACEMIEPLVSGAQLLVFDGQIDRLDPWTFGSVWDLLQRRVAKGCSVLASSIRSDVAARFDALVVVRRREIVFAGSPAELIRAHGETSVEVETDNQPGVRALAAPFEISVTETDHGAIFRAAEGQQLAAKLLVEGYGDVRFVVVKSPTLEDALRNS